MSNLKSLSGLVAAYEWDRLGKPTKVKLCTQGEIDYFIAENELGKMLLRLTQSFVSVRARVIKFDSMKVIEVEEISQQKLGGTP